VGGEGYTQEHGEQRCHHTDGKLAAKAGDLLLADNVLRLEQLFGGFPFPGKFRPVTGGPDLVASGSKSTVADPVIRFTLAELTPGVRSRVRWTLALQAAQVMPVTGMVAESVLI
jgi:hypothetical protein